MSFPNPTTSAPPPSLFRVIHPEDEPPDAGDSDPRDWTLSQFYERFVLPACHEGKNRRAGTIAAYRESLRLWAALTGDPPMRLIDDMTCCQFRRELAKRPGLRGRKTISPNTVVKHCIQIQMVLDRAGPRSRMNRLGQGLFAEPPYIERPEKSLNPPDRFHLDEICAWLDALPGTARLPRSMGDVDAARWWQALIVFIYNTGLRINPVISMQRAWIERRSPRGSPEAPPQSWLVIPAETMKKDRPFEIFLNTPAALAIEMVPRADDGRVFAWPGWPESKGWLQEQRRRQLAVAISNPKRRLGFHGLRRCALQWLAERNELVARKVASHSLALETKRVRATGDILADHYVGDDVVIALLERLPQPGPAKQKLLF